VSYEDKISTNFVLLFAHDKISELYDILEKQKPEYIIIKKISDSGFNTYCLVAGLLWKIKELRQLKYYDDLTISGFLNLHETDDTGTTTINSNLEKIEPEISYDGEKQTPDVIQNEKNTLAVLDSQKGKTDAHYQFQDVAWVPENLDTLSSPTKSPKEESKSISEKFSEESPSSPFEPDSPDFLMDFDISDYSETVSDSPEEFVYEADESLPPPPAEPAPPPAYIASPAAHVPINEEMAERQKTLKKIITGNIPYLTIGKKEEFEIKLIDIISSSNAIYKSEATIDVTNIPEYVDDVKVNVSVSCNPPEIAEIQGETVSEIRVPLDSGESTSAKFSINPKKEGVCNISVRLFLKGTNKVIGTLIMDPLVNSEQYEGSNTYTGSMDFTKSTESDLVLTIHPIGSSLERFTEDRFSYKISVSAPKLRLLNKTFNKHTVFKPKEYFDEKFSMIEKISPSDDPVKADDDMKSLGISLWEKMVPEDFQKWFWENRAKFNSIHIYSPEPWIPWEIIKPKRDGQIDDFLCEKYDFSRWIDGKTMPYPPIISNINIVLPKSDLKFAKKEAELVESYEENWTTNVDVISNYAELKQSLQPDNGDAPEIDIIQCIVHWKYRRRGDDSYIELGQEKFKAENMSMFYFREPHNPLIILNACQTGRPGYSLSGSDGWAQRCINQRAYAFIGTFWNVSDRCAFEFSTWLYHYIDKKINLDEAVKLARKKAKDGTQPGDPSWLAYCIYSPPQEKIKVGV